MSYLRGQRVIFAGTHPQLGEISGSAVVHRAYRRKTRLQIGQCVMTVPTTNVFGPETLAYQMYTGMTSQIRTDVRKGRKSKPARRVA